MGIPLAALALKPPEQPQDPIQNYARALQLKQQIANAPLQQQAMQQQVQAGAQENQQRQQAIDDQKATTDAMRSWDGKSMDDLPGLLLKHGASATAVFGMKDNILKQKTALNTLDESTFKLNQGKNDQLLGKLQAVTGGDDTTLPARLSQAVQESVQQGILDPAHAQQIGQITQQIQDPSKLKDALGVFEKGLMGQKAQFDQSQKERETAAKEQEAQARATTAQTTSTRLQAEMPGGSMQPVEQKELTDYLAKNPGKGPIDFAKYKASLAPQAAINVQGNIGGAQGDALVNAVAGGSMKIGDVLTPRTPLPIRQEFLNKVMAANPQFNSANYDIEKGVMKSATSGKIADNLTAFNTASDHLRQLSSATDALENTDSRTLNKIGNTLGYEFGSDKTTNFNVIKNAVSGEISKVFKGGQATDAEIAHVMQPFDAANTTAQLKGAIKQAQSLMDSKRTALREQVEKGKKGQANFGEDNSPASGAAHPFFSQFGGQARPQ